MRVFKKVGTKERLFEMFENVNKIKLNESIDNGFKYIVLKDDLGSFHDIKIPLDKYEDHLNLLYHNFGTNSQYQDVEFNPSKEYKLSTDILKNSDSDIVTRDFNESYDEDYVDPIAAARTSGEQQYQNREFERLSANNYQVFKKEYGIPNDVFNKMSDQEKRQELSDYLSIGESVNEAKENYSNLQWRDTDGHIYITLEDGREEKFDWWYTDENEALDYHVTSVDGSGYDYYLNDDNSLVAKFEIQCSTCNPDQPDWELNDLIDVVPYEQFAKENNISEAVEIPTDSIKAGARIPVKDISPETFPIGQHLPSYDTADAQQQMNSTGAIMRWKANFVKRFGEEGEAVKSEAWWWNIEGNPKFSEWKDRGIATKAAAMDADRAKGYKFHDNYDPKINESGDVNQEIDDELDMRYSHSTKTIPHDEINDVAEMYGVDFEVAAQIAADVIARNQSQGYEEITDDVKELVKRMHDTNVDPNKYSVKSIWQVFEKEYEAGSEFNEFKEIWDKLTKDPNQMKMFESGDNPKLESIQFYYDNDKGNWIPKGYEDKKVALRSLEQPLGSGVWRVGLVTLDEFGELDNIFAIKNNWKDAKAALLDSIT